LESLVVCTPNVSSICLVGIWVLVPSVWHYTNTEISVGLLRSRYETYPPQQFDLMVGEVDVLETPIVLGSHIVGSPKPEGPLLERIQPSLELTWEDVQESINSMVTTWVDSLVGEQLDIALK